MFRDYFMLSADFSYFVLGKAGCFALREQCHIHDHVRPSGFISMPSTLKKIAEVSRSNHLINSDIFLHSKENLELILEKN